MPAASAKPGIALKIMCLLLWSIMWRSIKLDNELDGDTSEICHVGSYWDLPPKFPPETAVSQTAPEYDFSGSHLATRTARIFQLAISSAVNFGGHGEPVADNPHPTRLRRATSRKREKGRAPCCRSQVGIVQGYV